MKTLVRTISNSTDFEPNRVFIVGNGAVENAGSAILSALDSTFAGRASDFPYRSPDPQNLNECLGLLSRHFQTFRLSAIEDLINFPEPNANRTNEQISKGLKNQIDFLTLHWNLRKVIGTALSRSFSIRKCPVDSSPEDGVICLNWDLSFWNASSEYHNLIQLHGIGSAPETMIFPTEYWDLEKFLRGQIKSTITPQADGRLPIDSGNSALATSLLEILNETGTTASDSFIATNEAHKIAVDWLSEANEVILWGVRLDPYDAEVSSILLATNGKPKDKIIVINLKSEMPRFCKLIPTLFPNAKAYEFIPADQ